MPFTRSAKLSYSPGAPRAGGASCRGPRSASNSVARGGGGRGNGAGRRFRLAEGGAFALFRFARGSCAEGITSARRDGREARKWGANPPRTRRCDRGRTSDETGERARLSATANESRDSPVRGPADGRGKAFEGRTIREPEDRPASATSNGSSALRGSRDPHACSRSGLAVALPPPPRGDPRRDLRLRRSAPSLAVRPVRRRRARRSRGDAAAPLPGPAADVPAGARLDGGRVRAPTRRDVRLVP